MDLPADAEAALDARIADALADHPDNDDLRGRGAGGVNPRKVVAVLQSGESITVTGDGLKPVTSAWPTRPGARSRSAAAPWCGRAQCQGRVVADPVA
jgi:penicillin-binding protein 1A